MLNQNDKENLSVFFELRFIKRETKLMETEKEQQY